MKSRFFNLARNESFQADYCGEHIGAVAVYADKVLLAKAHNTERTNPTQRHYNRYRISRDEIWNTPHKSHAEMEIFRKIRYLDLDFSRVTVYIYREHKKNGTPALARPCAACERALRDLGIKDVYYTTDGGYERRKY